MKFYIGITDKQWFDFLAQKKPDEINFWRPTATQSFRSLEPGEMFLFKLHSPYHYIVGGGFFVTYSALPMSLAWESFKEKNGAPDYMTFSNTISHYFTEKSKIRTDPLIGCIILTLPFFFKEDEWIPIPSDWKPGIQRGKTYDATKGIGESIMDQVMIRLKSSYEFILTRGEESLESDIDIPRYGKDILRKSRLGQGSFRVLVTDAYRRSCAITGGKILPVLEAAHIKPFSDSGPYRISNGLLLRSDFHGLFDKGYITLTKDYHVEVSKKLKDDFDNGEEYLLYHGKNLVKIPENKIDQPSKEFIEWHNENIFTG